MSLELERALAEINKDEEKALALLSEVKALLGRNYKSCIRDAWMTGEYNRCCLKRWEGELQGIRNRYGPSWLVKARPL